MAKVITNQIRNICLTGHGGSGKTSVAEAMLYISKTTDRLGKTPEGNTVCDYDPEEIRRGFTLSTSIAPLMWKDTKINVLDTPGYLDFAGEAAQAMRVADSAIITVDGKAGLEVGTELAWNAATEAGLPRAFFVNKCDDPDADFERVFRQIHMAFGTAVCPVFVPVRCGNKVVMVDLIGMKAYEYDSKGGRAEIPMTDDFTALASQYKDVLNESLAGTNDDLMSKYFDGEEFTREEAVDALHNSIIEGSIVPVYCGSATSLWGIIALMDAIADSFPRHTAKKVEKSIDGFDIPIEKEGNDTELFVFKTVADPFVGKMSFFKVMTGTLNNTMVLKNLHTGFDEKMSHIYIMRGKKQIEVDELACGDIGMITKPFCTYTNDTLAVREDMPQYKRIEFPQPFMTMAIVPKAKGDEDKIQSAIARLIEEDPTLHYENNPETKQLLLSGLGDIHLDVVVCKLKTRYGTTVELTAPKIAYRESIRRHIQAEGKHKKQSGGHGQYGHVRITFSPGSEEGLTFTESVVGGAVPKSFFPAVEKGLQESMQKGVLAGYPMVNLAADLYDGSYHDVDSSEMAFKIAANLAYKELINADPVLLEPVGELKVTVPDSMVGDVIGDLNKRRGRVLGMSPVDGKKGYQVVEAEVPKAEMIDYSIALRAISQGKGKYTFYVVRYEDVPQAVAQKIIAAAKAEE